MARRRRPICAAGAAFASQDATAFPSVLSVSVVTFLILRLNKPHANLSNHAGRKIQNPASNFTPPQTARQKINMNP